MGHENDEIVKWKCQLKTGNTHNVQDWQRITSWIRYLTALALVFEVLPMRNKKMASGGQVNQKTNSSMTATYYYIIAPAMTS